MLRIREKFCKDNKLAIGVFRDPYFMDRIELFDRAEGGVLDKYNSFETIINNRFNGNAEEYFEHYNNVKENAIQYIKNSRNFKEINDDDMSKYAVNCNVVSGDVYNYGCVGRKFISIDMTKANYTSLVHYARELDSKHASTDYILRQDYDWERLMEQFTDIENIIKSKYIRQVIFGQCNLKRHMTYMKYLTYNLLKEMILNNLVSNKEVFRLNNDEIVIIADNMEESRVLAIKDFIENKTDDIPWKFDYFILGSVINTEAFIIGKLSSKNEILSTSYKKLNALESPFVLRKHLGEDIQESDTYFMHEKRKLAKLIDIPEVEFTFDSKKAIESRSSKSGHHETY